MLNVGFLGFGNQAANQHAKHIVENWAERVRIVAIGDILVSTARVVAEYQRLLHLEDAPVYTISDAQARDPHDVQSVEELLNDHPHIQLMIISTPPAKHYAQIKYCLDHGIHVLVDKPPALTYSDARRLTELAGNDNGPYLLVASQRRYEEAYVYAKRVIQSGRIGTIHSINGVISHSQDWMTGWRLDPHVSGGGVLWDSGWHLIDTTVHLLAKKAVAIQASCYRPPSLAVETYVNALLLFEQGVSVNLTMNTGAPRNSVYESLEIWGSDGILFLRRHRPHYTTEPPSVLCQLHDGSVAPFDPQSFEGKRWAPTEAFLKFLTAPLEPPAAREQAKAHLTSWGHECVETVRIIQAMYASMNSDAQTQPRELAISLGGDTVQVRASDRTNSD